MDALLKRFLKFPVKPQAQWQGGIFCFGELVGGELKNSPMADAKMALWVSQETGLVHGHPSLEGTPLDLLISELMEFAKTQKFGYRPASIVVADKTLAGLLSKELAGSGTDVSWEAEPDLLSKVKSDMARHMRGTDLGGEGSIGRPTLSESDCSLPQIRAFAEAAAAFYRARPWQYLDDFDLLKFHTPKPPSYLKHATVLGSGRQEFGLGFYESTDTHWDMRADRLDMDSVELFSLTFNPISIVHESDVAFWKEHELPLETGDAFPLVMFWSGTRSRAPNSRELEFITIVLAAMAETTELEIDSGHWSKEVVVQNKVKKCQISIPDLLKPPSRKAWIQRGVMPDPRENERHFRLINSFIAQNPEMAPEQLNEVLKNQFSGSLDDFEYPSETPFDRADNLCYAAIEACGRRRIQLARQALLEDPSHLEANILIAEEMFDLSARIELFRKAVQLGEVRFADLLATSVGEFWTISETRPLIRAKYGLANALESDGQTREAIDQMLDILRLNTNDNLGVRVLIIPLMLKQNRDSEAIEILDRYPEQTASWLYLRAQVEYRRAGRDHRTSHRAIAEAFEFNPHVIRLLMADAPRLQPEHYALRSPEEASIVIEEQAEAWMATEGFAEWMFTRFALWERESLKRELDKRQRRNPKKR